MFVPRLNEIEHINDLENKFAIDYGIKPFNISSWHVSNEFRNLMLQNFKMPIHGNEIDYVYTYSITKEDKQLLLNKLGIEKPKNTTAIITQNNTISIVNIANLIQKYCYKKVCIINPAYFSVSQVFDSMSINYGYEYMVRIDGDYKLPINKILNSDYDVIWLTSPVYSTGIYLSEKCIEQINYLLRNEFLIITDESFALNGYELIRKIEIPDNLIAIYCPHKAISFNGLKFSCIVISEKHEVFMDQWIDVFCGNLPQSTCSAVSHFLSHNYQLCSNIFIGEMNKTFQNISDCFCNDRIQLDKNFTGSLFSVYFKNIDYNYTKSDSFHLKLFEKTYSSLLPGYLNGFSSEYGLCFRINLALDSIEFRQAVKRVIQYLVTL